jgi:predicted NACHT family NTPase
MKALSEEKVERILELANNTDFQHHENDGCKGFNNCRSGDPYYSKIGREAGCNWKTVRRYLDSDYRERDNEISRILQKEKNVYVNQHLPKILDAFDGSSRRFRFKEIAERSGLPLESVKKGINIFGEQMGEISPVKKEGKRVYLDIRSPYSAIVGLK